MFFASVWFVFESIMLMCYVLHKLNTPLKKMKKKLILIIDKASRLMEILINAKIHKYKIYHDSTYKN